MSIRTPAFIYAADPMSALGAKAQLMSQPLIELVSPADIDRARIALVITDSVDEAAVKVVTAIQRNGVPKVIVVASRFDEEGVVAAVAAGAASFLRRSEATSDRLAAEIRKVDQSGRQLPEGLLRRAAALTGIDTSLNLSDASSYSDSPSGSVGTITAQVCLSDREVEVLQLVAAGMDTTDVAEALGYSESTIKGVLAKVMGRLEARNRCHAVAIAVRDGLI